MECEVGGRNWNNNYYDIHNTMNILLLVTMVM